MTSPPRTRSKGLRDGGSEEGGDVVGGSCNEYFSNFEGESNNDERKISADADKTSEGNVPRVTPENADIANLFANSLMFTSAGTSTDPPTKQPTNEQIKLADFPTGFTVENAQASAKINRPDLIRRLHAGNHMKPSQPVAVYEHETGKLLRVFPTIAGVPTKNDGKPSKESLLHAFGLGAGYRCDGDRFNHFFTVEHIESHSVFVEKSKEVTDESKAKFDELVEKASTVREFNRFSKFHKPNHNRGHRESNQIVELYEWHEDKKRKGEKPVNKYSGTELCKNEVGNGWGKAGYRHFPADRLHKGVIWRKVFFIKLKTLEVDEMYDMDAAFEAIEVNITRFKELMKLFHGGKCKKGCNCIMTQAVPDYMHNSNYESFIQKLSTGRW